MPEDNQSFSILDYGCGYGALQKWLKLNNFSIHKYIGYDISEEMLKVAYENNSKNDKTIWTSKLDNVKVDYVLASGIFKIKLNSTELIWKKYIEDTLTHFNQIALKGFSFNILTDYSDLKFRKEHLFYASPDYIFNYCKQNFFRYIALLHDFHYN